MRGCREDIEHRVPPGIVREREHVVEDEHGRLAFRGEDVRECQANQHGDLLARTTAQQREALLATARACQAGDRQILVYLQCAIAKEPAQVRRHPGLDRSKKTLFRSALGGMQLARKEFEDVGLALQGIALGLCPIKLELSERDLLVKSDADMGLDRGLKACHGLLGTLARIGAILDSLVETRDPCFDQCGFVGRRHSLDAGNQTFEPCDLGSTLVEGCLARVWGHLGIEFVHLGQASRCVCRPAWRVPARVMR